MLKTATPSRVLAFAILAFAILFGVLASVAARGLDEAAGGVLALLVLSAAIAAVAQQTLP